jgi:hypothetical protein
VKNEIINEMNRTLTHAKRIVSLCYCDIEGVKMLTVPNFPSDPKKGTHTIPFSGVIYIERSDFREEDIKVLSRHIVHILLLDSISPRNLDNEKNITK